MSMIVYVFTGLEVITLVILLPLNMYMCFHLKSKINSQYDGVMLL